VTALDVSFDVLAEDGVDCHLPATTGCDEISAPARRALPLPRGFTL